MVVDRGKIYLCFSHIYVDLKSLVFLRTCLLAFGRMAVTSKIIQTGIRSGVVRDLKHTYGIHTFDS
jgi:hypothetical protein